MKFQDFFCQIRTEIMTVINLIILNNYVIQFLLSVNDFDITCVIRFNKQCYHINWLQFQCFVKIWNQNIYMFLVIHYHIKIKHDSLLIDKLLKILNKNHVKKSDLFFYIKKMLIIIFYNICIFLKLINSVWNMIADIISNFNDKLLTWLKYWWE